MMKKAVVTVQRGKGCINPLTWQMAELMEEDRELKPQPYAQGQEPPGLSFLLAWHGTVGARRGVVTEGEGTAALGVVPLEAVHAGWGRGQGRQTQAAPGWVWPHEKCHRGSHVPN